MNENNRFGVAIGPIEPGDSSIFDRIVNSFDDIIAENCKVKTYEEYNFFSVEVPNYSDAKALCTYNSDNIKITMVDIKNFDENVKKIWSLLPNCINKKCVNFSRAPTKFKISFRFPPNITTLIFLALMYSIQNNIEINRFNFSNCNISKENGFTNFLNYFPNLKEINLSGNPIVFNEPEYYFGSARIITDDPSDEAFRQSSKKTQNEEPQPDDDDYITEQPQLVFQSLEKDTAVTLDMFTSIQFNVDEFPTNGFICNFLKLMWNNIPNCLDYYFENAIFSIILQNSPKTVLFNDFDSDCKIDSIKHFYGNLNIIQILQQMFPFGFKANPTSMSCSIIGNNVFSVIIHGVFAVNESLLLGFDRSFFIVFFNYNFKIMNDNIFIRDPPNIY